MEAAILVIDTNKTPDWDAAHAYIEQLPADHKAFSEQIAEFEGFPSADGTPEEQARQALREFLDELRVACTLVEEGQPAAWYERRQLESRKIDLHIVDGDLEMGEGLLDGLCQLEDIGGVFEAAGFDA